MTVTRFSPSLWEGEREGVGYQAPLFHFAQQSGFYSF